MLSREVDQVGVGMNRSTRGEVQSALSGPTEWIHVLYKNIPLPFFKYNIKNFICP